MNRFISRNRDDRSANEKNRELRDEDRQQLARNREERLQRSIQSTLKSLGRRIDSSHKKIDDRRSHARSDSKGKHPDKPNKFWADSMKKVPNVKQVQSKIAFNEDSPRATNFPDLDDFLGKAPDELSHSVGTPLASKSPKSYNEDDNKSVEIIQLNKDQNDDSMDFDDPEENQEQQLTVDLTNLVGGATPDQAKTVTNKSDSQTPRSTASKKRASQLGRDQYGQTLFDFFKSLDYKPGVPNNQTVRASYKSGRGSYNLYGVPGSKPGDKGQVFIQSQDGFDKDLPPVRLSDKQRDQLINNFQELERLTSQDDMSENDLGDETPDKKEIPTTPNISARQKQDILKNNKTFWSSGVENSKPVSVPQLNKKPKHEKKFQDEYNRLMGYEETVTPGGGMETPQESEKDETPIGEAPSANKSIFKTAYNSMLSSIYGGFGGFSGPTPTGETPNPPPVYEEKPTLKQQNQPLVVPIDKLIEPRRAPRAVSPSDEWKKPQKLPPTRDKSPMIGHQKPNHHRFNRKPEEQRPKSKPRQPDPFYTPPVVNLPEQPHENSLKSFKTSQSGSLRDKGRKPTVLKLTSDDFQKKKVPFHDPYNPKNYPSQDDDTDPNMPNVIILVADNVKLIRNNAVPMLQVQLEIIQSAMNYDSDMCMLGLNDVIYIVPEFTVSEYDNIYSRICNGEEYEDFKGFFEHYAKFVYNPMSDTANLPERMVGLNKNCMTAIERDHYEPDLRGKAFINLKNVPNGHYTIFYLRIGQPISINSRLKVLGKAKHIYVNINREKIVQCKKPQLDLNHSSSRISKRETSKLKIIKAQQAQKRDNKILSLNSDDEDDNDEKEQPLQQILEKKADEELKKIKSSDVTRDDSKDDTGLEMEFDDDNRSKASSKIQPPPLQDSKEYYNSTQRMSEAMIKNPQFQIFSIDEEESQRTSMRESVEYRQSVDSEKYPIIPDKSEDEVYIPPATPEMPTPHPDAPEDAFRNVHRKTEDYSVTNDASNLPRPSTKDEISKQIEEYQKNSLAQLANFMNSEPTPSLPSSRKYENPRAEEYKPPQVSEKVPPLQISQQKSMNEFHGKRDSIKSGRSNGSTGSRRTRVKTISLKDLEEPEKPKTPWSPGQPRVSPKRERSNSIQGNKQRKITEIQVRPRSSSSHRGEQVDPFKEEMRETIKGNGAFVSQQMSARPNSRGSHKSREGGGQRPWAKRGENGAQRSRSRPQSNSRPFQGLQNMHVPQTPPEKMFDRYGNPLKQSPDEDMRPKSQAQPQAFENDNSLRSPSRGQDSGRNRFFRQRSNSQGSASSASRRRGPLANTYLGQKQNVQYNENFSDDGSPARADQIQIQQEKRMGRMGKRY